MDVELKVHGVPYEKVEPRMLRILFKIYFTFLRCLEDNSECDSIKCLYDFLTLKTVNNDVNIRYDNVMRSTITKEPGNTHHYGQLYIYFHVLPSILGFHGLIKTLRELWYVMLEYFNVNLLCQLNFMFIFVLFQALSMLYLSNIFYADYCPNQR